MAPRTEIAELIHSTKYRVPGETFRDAAQRVAFGLSDDGDHYHQIRKIFLDQRFMPAGRVQAAIGSGRNITPYNCYVSGTIADSFVDADGSIMDRAKEAATTLRMGGGIGYDFSTLRPSGDAIVKLGSQSSGPVSFMEIFNSICHCVASAGHRRGAQMAVLRVDHPDIMKFISAKHENGKLTGFNISVAVTDKFMRAVEHDEEHDLIFEGRIYQTLRARDLWEMIMRSTWEWAEPGVLFIDRINGMNNLRYCEMIAATNPCGEQPLPPFGACLLGSFNLVKYLEVQRDQPAIFNMSKLENDIPAIVRAMDNVVDKATYPLPQQREEARAKRRMGLGITGLANTVETLGWPYGSPEAVQFTKDILRLIANASYRASAELAAEKDPFPLYSDQYLESPFVRKLDPDVQELIRMHGIRNSHLTSIAPTGTISISADNISSGIEPVFSKYSKRPINLPGQEGKIFEFVDYAFREFGTEPRESESVTAQEHIGMLCAAQEWVDSSVSKTCIVSGSMPWEDFKSLYMDAWRGGAKGCTTYTVGASKETLLLRSNGAEESVENEACMLDPETGERSCE